MKVEAVGDSATRGKLEMLGLISEGAHIVGGDVVVRLIDDGVMS